jgi:NitT/TauT family transport system permease protein
VSRSALERAAPWLATLSLFITWWLVVVLFKIEDYILPSPIAAVAAVYKYRYALTVHGTATLITTILGFAIAVAFGLLLGIVIGSFRLAYCALYPVLIGINSVPKAALVPIFVIWFGVGAGPAIVTAFMLSFFPVVVNVASGFATIEPELVDVLRSLGATRGDIIRKVAIPRSLPHFFASLKIAITLAFVGSVIAEIVAGNNGIGNVMLIAGSNFDVPLVFAALLVVGTMGIGMYAIFAFFERRLTGWSRRGVAGIEYAIGG